MIKTEKEKLLLQTISDLFKNKIIEPKGIYLTEVSEFAEELEQNLFSLGEREQKIYLKRVIDKFNDWIDETTISLVYATGKPKNKSEKNLHALVFTVNYVMGVLQTNVYRFFTDKTEIEEQEKKIVKDKLTHKQQILTLFSIGFFNLPFVETLGAKQKGVLVSHILNRTEKDSEDLIRYFGGKTKEKSGKYVTRTPENIKVVKELLSKIGKKDIDV